MGNLQSSEDSKFIYTEVTLYKLLAIKQAANLLIHIFGERIARILDFCSRPSLSNFFAYFNRNYDNLYNYLEDVKSLSKLINGINLFLMGTAEEEEIGYISIRRFMEIKHFLKFKRDYLTKPTKKIDKIGTKMYSPLNCEFKKTHYLIYSLACNLTSAFEFRFFTITHEKALNHYERRFSFLKTENIYFHELSNFGYYRDNLPISSSIELKFLNLVKSYEKVRGLVTIFKIMFILIKENERGSNFYQTLWEICNNYYKLYGDIPLSTATVAKLYNENLEKVKEELEEKVVDKELDELIEKEAITVDYEKYERIVDIAKQKLIAMQNRESSIVRKNPFLNLLGEVINVCSEDQNAQQLAAQLCEDATEFINNTVTEVITSKTNIPPQIAERFVSTTTGLVPKILGNFKVKTHIDHYRNKINSEIRKMAAEAKMLEIETKKRMLADIRIVVKAINTAASRFQRNIGLGYLTSRIDNGFGLPSSDDPQFLEAMSLAGELDTIYKSDQTPIFQINPLAFLKDIFSGKKSFSEALTGALILNMKFTDIVYENVIIKLINRGDIEGAKKAIQLLKWTIKNKKEIAERNELGFINRLNASARVDSLKSLELYHDQIALFCSEKNNRKRYAMLQEGLEQRDYSGYFGFFRYVRDSIAHFRDKLFAGIANRFRYFNVSSSISKRYDIAVSMRLEAMINNWDQNELALSYIDRYKNKFKRKWLVDWSAESESKISEPQKQEERPQEPTPSKEEALAKKHAGLRYTRFVKSFSRSHLFFNFLRLYGRKNKLSTLVTKLMEDFIQGKGRGLQGEYERNVVSSLLGKKRDGPGVSILNFKDHYEIFLDPQIKPVKIPKKSV